MKITSAAEICRSRAENLKMRERDFAESLGITEAQLLAAHIGYGVTRIQSHPDQIIPLAVALGEVMALTRNPSCVNERVGVYANYRAGAHVCSVIADEIDLRIYPKHWCFAFLVEKEIEDGIRRSVQIFDAAGDAVHKIFLRETSELGAFVEAKLDLAHEDQSETIQVTERSPVDGPRADATKRGALIAGWDGMADTHQFKGIMRALDMNRLGAYRLVGTPRVRLLAPESVNVALAAIHDCDVEIMIFSGNDGCLQIYGGAIDSLKPMGLWQNVLDARFNMHLRLDHITEVYEVQKPSKNGMIRSVEAFDAEGRTILQIFARGAANRDAWYGIIEQLESLQAAA